MQYVQNIALRCDKPHEAAVEAPDVRGSYSLFEKYY